MHALASIAESGMSLIWYYVTCTLINSFVMQRSSTVSSLFRHYHNTRTWRQKIWCTYTIWRSISSCSCLEKRLELLCTLTKCWYQICSDSFAQNNLVQLGYHLFLKEVIELHANFATVVSSAFLALRQLAFSGIANVTVKSFCYVSLERCKQILLQCDFFQLCLKLIGLHENSSDVVTNACGVIEALASSGEFKFPFVSMS